MGQKLSRGFLKLKRKSLPRGEGSDNRPQNEKNRRRSLFQENECSSQDEENSLLTDDGIKEREVKKANRELNNLTSKMDDLQKIETLQKRVTEHLADMKRLERDNQKNKKRGDILQKEKDHSRSELSKSLTLREKLEKLCRELQRENNRLKVCLKCGPGRCAREMLMSWVRARTRHCKILRKQIMLLGTTNLSSCFGSCKTTKIRKTILKPKLLIWRSKNCWQPLRFVSSQVLMLLLDSNNASSL